MTNLQVEGTLTLDSREVAEMVKKKHGHLLRDIKTYIEHISANPNLDSLEFFIPSTYIDSQGKERPNYQITKKGCEFIAHKLTGQKGALFTATYINRFHEMEKALEKPKAIPDDTKTKEVEARLKNAKVREANVYLKIADKVEIAEYQQIMYSKATEVLSGQALIPLPETEKTYSATDIGIEVGASANMVGRVANKHNLKTQEFGLYVWDKSSSSPKQVETWRYNENGRKKLIELFGKKGTN